MGTQDLDTCSLTFVVVLYFLLSRFAHESRMPMPVFAISCPSHRLNPEPLAASINGLLQEGHDNRML